jgi:glutamate synthase (NADPH/NADH) small chain
VTTLHAVEVRTIRDDGRLRVEPVPGTAFELGVDLVLLAMGFSGPERHGLLASLDVRLTDRGNVWRDEHWMTSVPGVFTAGDMQRGQSLIVWAIAEGRSAARGVDLYLMGESDLPAPVV